MTRIPLDEAQQRLSELMDDAARGEEVVIARGDGASFRLVHVVEPAPRPRQGGGLKGRLVVPDDFDDPLPDFEPYM